MDKNELRQAIKEQVEWVMKLHDTPISERASKRRIGVATENLLQRLEQPLAEARIQSEQAEAYARAIDLIWGQAKLDLDGLRAPHEWPLASKVFDILHHDAPGSISEGDERAYRNHEKPANLAQELYDLGVKAEALRLERDSLHAKVRSMQDLAKGALDGTSEHQLLQDNCVALQAILDS
jgi:hypothetical protein